MDSRARSRRSVMDRRSHPQPRARRSGRTGLLSGGTEGNERLTVLTGALLIVLLAALGVTIVFIGRLLWWHLFLGLALIGPVGLKMASTGYRFMRYYTADPVYRDKGPPAVVLRVLGPVLVAVTAIVFATGVALLLVGPSNRGLVLLAHKVSFICWLVVVGVHIAGHLPEMVRFQLISRQTRAQLNELRLLAPGFGGAAEPPPDHPIPGSGGRWLSVGAAIALGVVLAVLFLPDFGTWTGAQGLLHHHHDLH
jgi:hypothetical protein